VSRFYTQHQVSIHGHQYSKQKIKVEIINQEKHVRPRKLASREANPIIQTVLHQINTSGPSFQINILSANSIDPLRLLHAMCCQSCHEEVISHTWARVGESDAKSESKTSRIKPQPASTTESSTTNHAPVPANHPETTC
jgi:hypothetical protein